MYLFLCNLALVDVMFPSTTVPLLLYMLSSGNDRVSFKQCYTQMYFFIVAAVTEALLLVTMAYDRYVAICRPLHYHRILGKKNCKLFTVACWTIGNVNSTEMTIIASGMSFCSSNIIKQYFCDVKALTNLASAGSDVFYTAIYADFFFFGLWPLLGCLTSYSKVIAVILSIKTKDGRQKAFSTCSSHITVIVIYYGSSALNFLTSSREYFQFQEQFITALYANVPPMLNPLIYSLRSKELKQALQKIFK
ncbi:olfactory receptor 5V1-like [Mantella aurantiaca]